MAVLETIGLSTIFITGKICRLLEISCRKGLECVALSHLQFQVRVQKQLDQKIIMTAGDVLICQ